MSQEYFDVVIVGAGLSGIGMAYHLQTHCPQKSYVILEAREQLGGTWSLFNYPGIRSDSDMYTLGYGFKPWKKAKAIADGDSILDYLKETASENNINQHIRFGQKVVQANWSSEEQCWTLTISNASNQTEKEIKCGFLKLCSGYYNYDKGHTPKFQDQDQFQGDIIHPQKWPENYDYTDKKITVIGSGATAVTLIPSLAQKAKHVTMLQRSPSYYLAMPDKDGLADFMRKILPVRWAYAVIRWKNVAIQQLFYKASRKYPERVKNWLIRSVTKGLKEQQDTKKHFTPDYKPWDQRLCLVPNGDLFKTLNEGKATIITDEIECFTKTGLALKSGQTVESDVIVTATGLELVLLGGIQFTKDGQPIDFSQTVSYRGIMCSGVPNMIVTFGYTNASWTLRADLIAEYTCRLLNYMDEKSCKSCTPTLRAEDRDMQLGSWVGEFSPNYIMRSLHLLPKQGDHDPWLNKPVYKRDKKILRQANLDDGVLKFS